MAERLDVEERVEAMLDVVQFGRGHDVEHKVQDPDALRALLRAGARARKLRVRTGVSGPAPVTVWVARTDEELDFTHPPDAERTKRLVEEAFRNTDGSP